MVNTNTVLETKIICLHPQLQQVLSQQTAEVSVAGLTRQPAAYASPVTLHW